MYGTEIKEKFTISCKDSRVEHVNSLLDDESNEFRVHNTGNKAQLKLGNTTVCDLYKKEHTKIVDWDNLKFEHSKFLKNKNDEEIEVIYAKVRLHYSHPDNPTGSNTTVMVFKNNNIEFETNSSATYSDGSDLSNFQNNKNILYVSDGDRKRLGTYPIFIYKNENKTKNTRFQMRYI